MIPRLNIRHALPQIGIRSRQSTVDDSHMVPAELHNNNRQAQSNKGATQARIDINSYQSRKAYGARNMDDFTSERGQRGISDVQASTSRHAQATWSMIENGARRGNYIQQRAEQAIYSEAKKTRYLEAQFIPNPTTTLVEPSRVVGESDLGDVTYNIDAKSYASIQITTGSAQTYIQNQGFLRGWITEDKYDIYA